MPVVDWQTVSHSVRIPSWVQEHLVCVHRVVLDKDISTTNAWIHSVQAFMASRGWNLTLVIPFNITLYTGLKNMCYKLWFFLGSIKQMSRQTECCSGGADRSHRQKHRQPWSGSLSAQWRVKQISERWPVRSVLDVRASEQVKWWMLPLNDRWRTEMCCRNP